MKAWFGVDIGGTSVKTALVSPTGQILAKSNFETHLEPEPIDLSRRIHEALKESLNRINLTVGEVLGVGVGVPALKFDFEQRVVLEAVNLGWKNVAFAKALEQELQLPSALENDANLAALGEAWVGAGRGAKSALCVTVGTGVGAGIVLNGHLYRGVGGVAGEIGHLTVEREHGLLCNCGKSGCLETVASASSIVRDAKRQQQQGALPSHLPISGAKEVFDMAFHGYSAAEEIVTRAADWLGYGLSLAATVLNPDAIVIGGGVSKAGEQFLESVRKAMVRYTLGKTFSDVTVSLAELGNDAGVIGAARLVSQMHPWDTGTKQRQS